ncbi:MAG: biosynthetic-type acetolactate synthase large subunit [Thermoplasmata archaeon]|nr:biosynthetic-type acetolactate synthase large subunit [Thermoplasmata archaeon]
MKGSRALLQMLEDRGVKQTFGYPGGSVIPIFDEVLNSSIENILVRHEQCAAHMADGFTRASGEPGVCLVTSGPGVTNAVTGVATAQADSIPMMVLTGQVASGMLGMGAFQEVDAFSLMMPITKYNYRVLELQQLPQAIDEGWKIMQYGRPAPVHIDLPVDSMNSEIDESMLNCSYEPRKINTDKTLLLAAIAEMKSARRPVIYAGGGVIGANASNELVKLAEMLGAPVVTSMMGLGCIPYDHPLSLGPLGMHGKLAALDAIKNADLLIAVGTKFSDRTYSAKSCVSPGCRIIHVDIDATEFGKHGLDSLNILADVKETLTLFIGGLEDVSPKQEWLAVAAGFKARCDGCRIDFDNERILPQRVMYEINKFIDDDTIITTDVGQNQMWAMHHLRIRKPRQFISSGNFGTMGFGLPAAMGAQVACPDKKVISIVGDGGLLMVIQELATAVHYGYPVVICLMNNGWLGMVKQWQKLFWNERYSSTKLFDSNPDFVKIAEAFGANGIRVEKPGEIGDALRQAFASGKTTLIDIWVDPEEDALPMLPANNTAMVKGRCPY